MGSDSQRSSAADRSLWLIAFALLSIALCLVVLVFRALLSGSREKPAEEASPPDSLTYQESPHRWLGAVTIHRHPPAPAREAKTAAPEPVPSETAPSAQPVAAVVTKVVSGPAIGGLFPLGGAGDINYKTAIIGKVTLRGEAPPEEALDVSGDPYCARLKTTALTTRYYVVSTNGELADVLVFISDGAPKREFFAARLEWHLEFTNCQIEPYMTATMRRQGLVVKNDDTISHILRFSLPFDPGMLIPVAAHRTVSLPMAPEAALFVPLRCQTHPWELAYVSFLEHPFAAVTGTDGRFVITNIPPGKYILEACHQKTHGTNGITQPITLKRGEVVTANFVIESVVPQPSPSSRAQLHVGRF